RFVEARPLEPVELRRERERAEVDAYGAGDRVRRVEVERDERDQRVAGDGARQIDVREDVERELEVELAAVGDGEEQPRPGHHGDADDGGGADRQADVERGLTDL